MTSNSVCLFISFRLGWFPALIVRVSTAGFLFSINKVFGGRDFMQGQMMNYPLTLPHFLERAGKLFSQVEVVSRLPDKSLHRYTYGDFYRRARGLAEALQKAAFNGGERRGNSMWKN